MLSSSSRVTSTRSPSAPPQRLGGVRRERLGDDQPDGRGVPAAGELERGPAGDQAAVVDDVDPVGEALGLLHVVRGQHDGDAGAAELLEQLPRRTTGGRVHAGGRLVDERDLGTPDDRHRESEPLLLAPREPSVRRAPALAEPEPLGQRVEVERVGVQPGDVAQHLVGPHTAPRPAPLEHHADPGEQRAPVGHRVEPEHPHRARVRAPVALGGLERRGLPGAVGSEHRGDRAAVDAQRQPVDGDLVAVPHDQSVDRDGRGPRG